MKDTLPVTEKNEFGRFAGDIATMPNLLVESISQVRDRTAQIAIGSWNRQLIAWSKLLLPYDRIQAMLSRRITVSSSADKGSERVCYMIDKMRDISVSSDNIADTLGVIDGIAFQTNVLALNASVKRIAI